MGPMATFSVRFVVRHPVDPDRQVGLEGLVDTGALLSQIPAEILGRIGIAPTGTRAVHYADGVRDVVSVAKAGIAIDGVETATLVLCGRPGSLVLIGATTLETLGLGVDPIHRKLIPVEVPMAMLKQPSPEYRGFRRAGIRLSEEMLPELGRLYGSRTRPMQRVMHAFDKAHAVMLVEEGLLRPEHGAAILKALRAMEREDVEETRARVGGGLHSGEQYLIRALGEEIGGRLHLARSSGDLSSVGINTLQRDALLDVLDAVNRLRRVLLDLARQHTDTILPGYSFGQHAQPHDPGPPVPLVDGQPGPRL
jgi:predicted aspartyl protease